jgi:rubrerythrin
MTENKVSGSLGTVTVPRWGPCRTCGHTWTGRIETKPVACPNCTTRYWDVPYSRTRRKRKPKPF